MVTNTPSVPLWILLKHIFSSVSKISSRRLHDDDFRALFWDAPILSPHLMLSMDFNSEICSALVLSNCYSVSTRAQKLQTKGVTRTAKINLCHFPNHIKMYASLLLWFLKWLLSIVVFYVFFCINRLKKASVQLNLKASHIDLKRFIKID